MQILTTSVNQSGSTRDGMLGLDYGRTMRGGQEWNKGWADWTYDPSRWTAILIVRKCGGGVANNCAVVAYVVFCPPVAVVVSLKEMK